jgi:hypothetical protein
LPYVGNTPALNYTSFAVQHFTTSATTGYTLDHAVTNENDIRLVINNVVQQPGSSYAYTASGTTLTLSAATAGTDTMYCVFLGKAVQTVNPGAGSVGTSQIANSAVDLTSKVTGTLPIANGGTGSTSTTFTNLATNVTGALPQANISDQAINEAKMQISNAPTNGYMLTAQSSNTGGMTWAEAPSGAWTLLETETITGSTPSTVDISSFDSSYNIHAVLFDNVGSSNDNNQIRHAFSSDSGSNFNVQIYGGGFGHKVDESPSASEDNFGSAAAGFVKIAEGVGSGSNEGLSGLIYYTGLKDTNRSTFYWGNTMVHTDNNKYTNYVLMGRCGTADIDAIRYNFNAGTFDMGIIKLFGIK